MNRFLLLLALLILIRLCFPAAAAVLTDDPEAADVLLLASLVGGVLVTAAKGTANWTASDASRAIRGADCDRWWVRRATWAPAPGLFRDDSETPLWMPDPLVYVGDQFPGAVGGMVHISGLPAGCGGMESI